MKKLLVSVTLLIAVAVSAQLIISTAQQKTKIEVQTKATAIANIISQNITSLYKIIWANPYKLSPCDAWASLQEIGVSAHTLFVDQLTVLAKAGIDISKLQGDGSTLVDNADGTVSCTPPAPVQPAAPAPTAPAGQ